MTKPFPVFTVMSAITTALCGCEVATSTIDRVTSVWSKPIVYQCPDYRILKDAAHLIGFKAGPGRDLVDVTVEASIRDAELECLTFVDQDTKSGHMEAQFKIAYLAVRGPADKNKRASLPYFISVTDKNRNVLYRDTLNLKIQFPGNQNKVQGTGEVIKLELPLSTKIKSKDYIIFTGFSLTREQLEYNRAQ